MSYKKDIVEILKDNKKNIFLKFKASIFLLVLSNLLFFLNYFFAGGGFHYKVCIFLFPYLYIFLVLSYLSFVYFLIKYKFPNLGNAIYLIIFIFLFIIFLLFFNLIAFGKDILNFI